MDYGCPPQFACSPLQRLFTAIHVGLYDLNSEQGETEDVISPTLLRGN